MIHTALDTGAAATELRDAVAAIDQHMPVDQIQTIATTGVPIEKLTFNAPASGYVIEKNVVEGAAIHAGDRVFRIAALDKVWVEADVFEADLERKKT